MQPSGRESRSSRSRDLIGAPSEAIRIPFEQEGYHIDPKALAGLVEDSHGYPYFLQLWGRAIWIQVRQSAGPIRMEEVDRARPRFEETRNRFSLERYQELKDRGLVAPAVALAEAYRGIDSLEDSKVDEVLKGALAADGQIARPSKLVKVRRELHDLGYIWSPGGARKHLYFSGIPSLMSFVADVSTP